jgi:protein-disulfide isomerase
MRNIWGWVIGILIAAGAGVTIVHFVQEQQPQREARAPEPAPPPATPAESAKAEAARPGAAKPESKAATGKAVTLPKIEATYTDLKITPDDYAIGKSDAPVTFVEYASLTCPHCADFHTNVLPAVKTEFIDTGKVRMIYRDYPLDKLALAASMIARCAGRDRDFGFIGAFFASQESWARDANPLAALGRIARVGGMSQQDVDACLKNSAIEDAVVRERLQGEKTFGVSATPTLFIGGDKVSGGVSIEQFRALVAKKLGSRKMGKS